MAIDPTLQRGSLAATLAGPGDEYTRLLHDPGRLAGQAQVKSELMAGGFDPYGVEAPRYEFRGDQRSADRVREQNDQWRAAWNAGGGGQDMATHKAAFDADWAKTHAPPTPTFGGIGSAGPYGGGPGGAGTFSGGIGGYELPDSAGASQAMRDMQLSSMRGLQGLMSRDTAGQRKSIEDALYAGQAEGINTAADRARQAMLEGTFGRGVGSSTITTELFGRGEQERGDALARARREAFTQAGSEERADLASLLGLNTAGFNAATTGLQGEANVALTNLARMQQESQFARNLGFQGSENQLNRAQQASQFGQNLGLGYAQMNAQSSENAANRAFAGGENALNREMTSSEAALNRALQELLVQSQQTFTGGQNDAQRELARYLQESGQTFAGGQNDAQRALTQSMAQAAQTWQGGQNQAQRDAAMEQLLLQLAQQRDLTSNAQTSSAVNSAISGAGNLLGPWLSEWAKSFGE